MAQWGSCCSIFSFLCSVLQIIVLLSLSFGHCIVVPSSIYGLVGFVLLDLQFSVQCFVDHCLVVPFFWPLYCRSFFNLWLSGVRVARSLVFCVVFCRSLFVLLSLSFGHCIVVPSSIYGLVGFVLLDLQFSVQCFVDHCLSCCPFLLAIVLSFLLQSMAQWGSCCSIFSFLCSVLQIIVCLVVPFFWPLYCRSFFNLWLSGVRVARSLVFCVVFCRSLSCCPFLLAIVLSFLLQSMTQWGSCCSIFSFLCSVLQIIVLLSLSFGHCIVVPSSIYDLVGFVLLDLQFSVQCFVDHCLSCCPFLLAIVLSFLLQSMAQWGSCCSIFSFLCSVLQIIVLLSLSFGHCIVVPSSIYGLVGFVLLDLQFSVQCFVDHCLSCCPFLLAIVLSFLLQSMTQWGSCFSIFSFLCSVLQIIVLLSLSFGHCIVVPSSIYGLVGFVLLDLQFSVQCFVDHCLVVPFFWPLYCRSFFNLWLSGVCVTRSLVFCVVFCRSLFVLLSLSFGHCIVVPSSIYDLVGFVFLDLQFSVQCFVDHCLVVPFFWPLYCRSFFNLWLSGVCVARSLVFCVVFCRSLLILLSLSFGHCIVVPSSIYGLVGFVLLDLQFSVQCFVDHCLSCCPFLLAIVLSFLLQSMAQWGSCCSIFSFLCSVLQIIVCLVVPFFWPLYCRSFFNLWLSGVRVARSLVFCVVFCRSLSCCPFLLAIVLSFLLQSMTQWGSCCSIFSFLCSVLQIIVLLSLSFGHCIVVPSSIYGLVGFVLLDLQFSVQCFVDHCLSCCPFLLAIVLSFLLQSMAQWGSCCSIFSFLCSVLQIIVCLVVPFFWPLYCRSFFNLWLSGVRVARSLVFCVVFCRSLFVLLSLSFGHCIVVPSSIYGLVGFVLLDLQFSVQCFVDHCLVLSLSFGHCIVVPSSIYGLVGFVLLDLQFSVQCFVDHCLSCCPFLLAIVLSFLLQSMAQWGSCCSIFSFLCSVLQIIVCLVVPFFWPLYCRSFFNLWLSGVRVARSLVFCVVFCRSLFVLLSLSFGHCIVVPSSIYGLVGFVLLDLQFSVQCFVDHCLSCCPFFWPLYCRSFFNLWLSGVRVARSLVFCVVFCRSLFVLLSLSFGHCIVVPSSIYGLVGFVLLDLQFSVQCFVDHCLSCCPFLLAIVLSFLLQSMTQWGSCCSIFSFLCSVLQIIVCLVVPFFWPLYCRSFFNL